jgi:hypothetical protein
MMRQPNARRASPKRAGALAAALSVSIICVLYVGALRAQTSPASPIRQQLARNACATAALADSKKVNLAILQSQAAQPFNMVKALVARRHARERLCLRFARCLDPSAEPSAPLEGTRFQSCLRDEASEAWDFPDDR